MFSFFKKKEPALPFKQRVTLFWQLFTAQEKELRDSISAGNTEKIIDLINSFFKRSNIEIAFQTGFNGDKYEFFFSPEGNRNVQFLTRCIIDMSPHLQHWLFYPSKPGVSESRLSEISIKLSDDTGITPGELFITPVLDEERNRFDIKVYHRALTNLPENDRFMITFLLLDEALGEYGTEMFIGKIEHSGTRSDGDIDLITFRKRVDGYKAEIGFDEDTTPDQLRSLYTIKPQDKSSYSLREDVYVINTTNIQLFENYGKSNLLEKFGASYIFAAIDMALFDMENFLNQRDEISDNIDLEMQNANDGFVVGFATGKQKCYIDLIIFDADNSISRLKAVLQAKYPDLHGEIYYVEKEKKNLSYSF
ncbi:MAG TPA: hypothetical protein VK154_07035 [Chitinophagales bacterium]|nr:hypothetical protein [Chitinophagales bacterium]